MRVTSLFHYFLLFCLLCGAGCSGQKIKGKTQAEIIYKEAQDLIESGRYILATDRLNTIKSNYPYSFYATHAELLLADVLYKQENYAEAAASYLLFRDMHPKHEKIPYVVWKIAESYYMQLPETYDRDLSAANEAIKYYSEVIQRYPDSDYRKKALEKVKKAKNMLLQKELYIADFYYRTDVHQAAKWRYLRILENPFEVEDKQLAMARIITTSYRLGEYDKCLAYYSLYNERLPSSRHKRLKKTIKRCQAKTPYED